MQFFYGFIAATILWVGFPVTNSFRKDYQFYRYRFKPLKAFVKAVKDIQLF